VAGARAIAVGVIGYFEPRTLGVGYNNIEEILSHSIVGNALLLLGILKFLSWSISLGSGTSGGTLAPLLTIGGAAGAATGELLAHLFPQLGIDPRIAALVGMAATFAGASRALLASVIFVFEATRQPLVCYLFSAVAAHLILIASLLMRNSIMTEKIARRGIRVPTEYSADFLDQVLVRDVSSSKVIALADSDKLRT